MSIYGELIPHPKHTQPSLKQKITTFWELGVGGLGRFIIILYLYFYSTHINNQCNDKVVYNTYD